MSEYMSTVNQIARAFDAHALFGAPTIPGATCLCGGQFADVMQHRKHVAEVTEGIVRRLQASAWEDGYIESARGWVNDIRDVTAPESNPYRQEDE